LASTQIYVGWYFVYQRDVLKATLVETQCPHLLSLRTKSFSLANSSHKEPSIPLGHTLHNDDHLTFDFRTQWYHVASSCRFVGSLQHSYSPSPRCIRRCRTRIHVAGGSNGNVCKDVDVYMLCAPACRREDTAACHETGSSNSWHAVSCEQGVRW
jgi:hypothetical protein